jgi:drug/metabolite transporter (DMT)-like permease
MPMTLFLLLAAILAAVGQVLFKSGAAGRVHWLEFLNPAVIGGLGCYGLSTVLWIYCLSKLPLRVVYPYTALTFVLVYLGAYLVFGEKPGARGIAGVVLVLAGLFMINGERTTPAPTASAASVER